MSDRTRVSTPRSAKKRQQQAKRDKLAEASIMKDLQEERDQIRLRKATRERQRLEQSSPEDTLPQVAGVPLSPDAAEFYPSIQEVAFNIRGQLQDPRVANFEGTEDPTQSRSIFDDRLAQAAEQPSFDESTINTIELDTTSRADSAAEVSHGAAYDAVGSSDVGVSASIGLDPDLVLHMDDFTEALRNIQDILLSQVKTEPIAENRRKATEMLRTSPGMIALIRAGDYRFEDFMTDGEIDIAKLTAARADLQKRIQSSEESYAMAAKAHGYAANGAAYPIAGVNNIVPGNRRISNSQYTIYQGPQYSNG